MASVSEMLSSAHRALRDADNLSDLNSADRESIESLNTTCARLLQALEKQEERNQKIAAALDELAEAIHYPTSSVRELRAKVREIARIARGEQRQEGR
jgi:methyl-accepting chemotaxis protein